MPRAVHWVLGAQHAPVAFRVLFAPHSHISAVQGRVDASGGQTMRVHPRILPQARTLECSTSQLAGLIRIRSLGEVTDTLQPPGTSPRLWMQVQTICARSELLSVVLLPVAVPPPWRLTPLQIAHTTTSYPPSHHHHHHTHAKMVRSCCPSVTSPSPLSSWWRWPRTCSGQVGVVCATCCVCHASMVSDKHHV